LTIGIRWDMAETFQFNYQNMKYSVRYKSDISYAMKIIQRLALSQVVRTHKLQTYTCWIDTLFNPSKIIQ